MQKKLCVIINGNCYLVQALGNMTMEEVKARYGKVEFKFKEVGDFAKSSKCKA